MSDLPSVFPIGDSNETPADMYLRGITDNQRIGNVSDALKVSIASEIITTFSRTYTAVAYNLNLGTNPTDIFTLSGVTGKKVRIIALDISGVKTNTGYIDLLAILRSSQNSGGTFTSPTIVSHESTDIAAGSSVKAYTVNPTTLGTSRGIIHAQKLFVPSANASSANSNSSFDLIKNIGKPITLLSPDELFCINLDGVNVPGGIFNVGISWIED